MINNVINIQSEKQIQEWIIRWFRTEFPPEKALIVHVANENPRGLDKMQAIKYHRAMRLLGRLKGFPDLMVLCNNKVGFFEVKAKSGKLSPEQEEILKQLQSLGFKAMTIRSQLEAEVCIKNFIEDCFV